MAIPGLSPQQLYQFQGDRNTYGTNLARGKAGNVYAQQLANLQFGRNANNFNVDWNRQRVNLPTSYLQRGLGHSGIYNTGLQNYAEDRSRAYGDMILKHQLEQAGLLFNDRELEDEYAQQMANNYARQFASQADIASQLRSIL